MTTSSATTAAPAGMAGGAPLTRSEWSARLAFLAMLGAWAFDFRSSGAGEGLATQSLFIAAYFAAVVLFYGTTRFRASGELTLFLLAGAWFLLSSLCNSLALGQDVYATFRHGTTIVIYLTMAHATYTLTVMLRARLALLRAPIAWMALLYAAAGAVIVGLSTGGIDVSSIRFQVVGMSVVAGLSYMAIALRRPLLNVEYAAVVVTLAMVTISVTRSFAVVAAATCLLMTLTLQVRSLPQLRRILLVIAAAGAVFALLQIAGVPSVERWLVRLLSAEGFGVDPTALTRELQGQSMLASIGENPLFGAGLQGESLYWLDRLYGGDGEISYEYGFGHNNHLSLIFVAGLVGGLPLLLAQLWQGWLAMVGVWSTRKAEGDLSFLHQLGACIVVGTLVYGTLGGTFGSRGLTLWYAVGTGLLFAARTIRRMRTAP